MLKKILSSKIVVFLEIFVLLFFSFRIGDEFLRRRSSEEEVSKLEEEIEKLKSKNDDLGAFLEYTKTDSFVEQEARKKLNLVQGGESLVLMPGVDVTDSQESPAYQEDQDKSDILSESNIKLWWKYFFDYNSLWMEE